MASIIRIKRSSVSGNPATLAAGELAYSGLTDNGSNGGDRLYIGMGTETSGNAANHVVIGGKYFTDMLDHTPGTLTASSAIILDANSKINNINVGNLTLTGSTNTISSTDTNGNIVLTPNGTGKTVLNNVYINGTVDTLAEYIYDTVGGAITSGTGITITNNDGANTSTVSITNTAVTAGSYGSATSIPTFTVNAQGQLTAAGSASISTTLNITGDTGTDAVALGTDTLSFTGGTGITSTVTNNAVDFSIDSTVATLTDSQTLTNKTLTSPLISAITGVSGNLVVTAASGNNSISLTPTGTGTVDVASKRITSLADPTQAQDAATKAYVDAVKTGLDIKDSVRAATAAPLTATYAGAGKTLTNSGTQAAFAIDGVTLALNERVLIKDQATGSQNGIYTVTTVGTVSTNWVLTRATDFDNTPGTEITAGAFTFVEEGAANADSGWVLTTNNPIVLDTSALTWAQFSGAGQVTAGAGLTKTGNTLDVIGTANRILVNADSVDIASTYVGQTSITTLGTIATGTWQGTIVGPTYGGTGVNNGSNTLTLAGNVSHAGAFTQTFTATANTSLTLPTSGTLATLAGTEALSNKTITLSSFSGTTIAGSGLATFTNATDASALGTAAVVLSGGLSVAKTMYIGLNITGAGAATSTLDGFNIDGGSY